MSYAKAIETAIVALKERSGSSLPALKKYMANMPKFQNHLLLKALKKGVEDGSLIKVKSSYKLAKKTKARYLTRFNIALACSFFLIEATCFAGWLGLLILVEVLIRNELRLSRFLILLLSLFVRHSVTISISSIA